ncbi:MAG: hypothetical protein KIT44_03410 [Opitutaceae bacterium]|nr:hypothetical protein [Opitutaceae bacterium]
MSVQRLCGAQAEDSPAAAALAGALERAATAAREPEEFEQRRQEIFAAEEARVQQAALTAELVAVFLARNTTYPRAMPGESLPAKPPARPRPVLPPSESDAIAGLIDGMLALNDRPAGR